MNKPSLQPEDLQPFVPGKGAQVLAINPGNRGPKWLMLSGLCCFALSFAAHQHFISAQSQVERLQAETAPGDITSEVTEGVAGLKPAAQSTQLALNAGNENTLAGNPNQLPALAEVGDAHPNRKATPSQSPLGEAVTGSAWEADIAESLQLPPAAGTGKAMPANRLSRAPGAEAGALLAQVPQEQTLQQLQLELLLQKAEAAFARDRLTTPLNDNAVHYFQNMLALQADHPLARAGILRVASRYAEFYQRLMARGETGRAQTMLAQAQALDPAGLTWKNYIETGNAASIADADQAPVAPASQPAHAAVQGVIGEKPAQPNAATAKRAGSQASHVTQSQQARLAEVIQQARSEIRYQRPEAAISMLMAELPAAPTHGELVEVLHQAYLAANRTQDAVNLRVTLQGTVPGFHLARMQAAELLGAGNLTQAIEILERNLPSYAQAPDYYGLLAGLYYKAQRFKDAEQAYERLLSLNPQFGSYWLGYAVALDAQGDEKARRAFERATETLAKQDAARDYALQRLRELGQS
ncbi:tetratricopeptide repeat protein [Simiduia sp. 21SJ11W-1]|uniref:tetratricopeptide repeat protein n=1 Tax=Simiduia sp. 21SJ11W-1 TaxID=2909669 RepID=UPI00209EA85F|nr:tetratricopeptide repeat protein [Simiduia sp. 21SJ11W-1]UTA46584.1 tetratricopeptide repeat protein [Simiduia sp. 21SJ11W-1]